MSKQRLHFMGIGGQGISAVAQIAHLQGGTVTGCDARVSATTRALEAVGIPIALGHDTAHLDGVDRLVISPAVTALQADNPEVVAAQEHGLPVVTWQQVLGELVREHCLFSIAGVHGKGTTTSLLTLMLDDAGLDPSAVIGAVVPRYGVNYRIGTGKLFVNEADEFNHNFWHYHPRFVVITAIEFEHPEFFANEAAFLQAFETFVRGMDFSDRWETPPTLLLNASSPGCLELWKRVQDLPLRVWTYSVEEQPLFQAEEHFQAEDIRVRGETSYSIKGAGFPQEMRFTMQLPGAFNIENALAASIAARVAGVQPEHIQKTVAGFTGTRRRFEVRAQHAFTRGSKQVNAMVVDDYAHHPTAIALTLEAARKRFPEKRLIAIYQPHMYSRTKTFLPQFASAFSEADLALVADIFPARERDTGLIHSRDLIAAVHEHEGSERASRFRYSGDVEQTLAILQEELADNDLVIIMGAGDIYTITDQLITR